MKLISAILFVLIIPFSVSAQISGTKTIGSGGNYATLNAAVADLMAGGISGPVVFKIKTGAYGEQVRIGPIHGASELNTVTFQSSSGNPADVIIHFASTEIENYIIKLDGSQYLNFKNLTFTADNGNGTIFYLGDKTRDISFTNDVFKESEPDITSDAVVYSSDKYYHLENLGFMNCTFNGGYNAIDISSSAVNPSRKLIISNCDFTNYYSTAISLKNFSEINFSGNKVSGSRVGVNVDNCGGTLNFVKNKLYENNVDFDLLHSRFRNPDSTLVANNFMESNTGSNSMRIEDCHNLNVYYNSFNSVGKSSFGPTMLVTLGCTNVSLINNIFAGSGTVLEIDYPSSASAVSDYNDYYTSYPVVVKFSGSEFESLKTYQSSTSMDLNSVNFDPGFASQVDLHSCSDSLSTAGTPAVNTVVPDDIDGDARDDKTPSIGADEYTTDMLIEDFENWTSGSPDNWLTDNHPDQGIIPITQTQNAYSGNYAMDGKVIKSSSQTTIGIAPMAAAGSDGLGFSFTNRVKSLTFHLNYSPVAGDKLLIIAALTKGASTNTQVLGLGVFDTTGTITDYQKITVPIRYKDSTSTPEHLVFEILVLGTQQTFPLPVQLPGQISSELPSDIKFYFPTVGSEYTIDDITADTSCVTKNEGGTTAAGNNGGYQCGNRDFYPIQFNALKEGQLLISGEKYNISWSVMDSAKVNSFNLSYTLDGKKFVPILTDYPDTSYTWKVPDSLVSTQSQLLVTSSADTSVYGIICLRMKPWQLSKYDTNGNFVLFDPTKDGWKFGNDSTEAWPSARWRNISYTFGLDPYTHSLYPSYPFHICLPSTFPTWKTFVSLFGVSHCYFQGPFGVLFYNPVATTFWYAISDEKWDGSCYGFAATSLLNFYHKSSFLHKNKGLPDYKNLDSVSTDSYIQELLAYYWLYQEGKLFRDEKDKKYDDYDVRHTLSDLKKMLGSGEDDGRVLSIYKSDESAGHAVTPYKLERINSSGRFRLRLYNSNVPNRTDSYVVIDSTKDIWIDSTKGFFDDNGKPENWGTGTKYFYLDRLSKDYLQKPSMFKQNAANSSSMNSVFAQPSPVTIYVTGHADVNVSDSKGNSIGVSGGKVINNINGGEPIIPLTGRNHPPIGYWLPDGSYSLKMDKFKDTTAYAFFVTDSLIYNYMRTSADSNQHDLLSFRNGLGIKNGDSLVKNINLQMIAYRSSSVKNFVVSNFKDFQGDSNFISIDGMNDLHITNDGKATSYDLSIQGITDNGAVNFVHKSVAISPNSAQVIEPDWKNPGNKEMKILIDKNNDGTYDDSTEVTNQVTQVNRGNSSNTPSEFRLFQNYPNPFNPTTTIKYQIPQSEHVTLSVYNTLGQLVRTLVNSYKTAGVYSVQFDGTRLSSGIYFYTIRAGRFRNVKKLLLLK